MLQIGAEAPDFTANLGSGGAFTLSEHRGRNVVIFFYPRAFTGGCTMETKAFSEAHDDFDRLNALVVGISTDSVDVLSRFAESLESKWDLASDAAGDIRRLYDVQRRLRLGTSRVTYVIDTEGIIQGVFHHEIFVLHHVQDALGTLRDLQ